MRRGSRRSGAVYRHGDVLLVHPINSTVTGLGVASEPLARQRFDAGVEVIGMAVQGALKAYREDIPSSREASAERGRAFLKAAGFRSWRSLERDALYCQFYDDGDQITFEPLRNGGTQGEKKGFQPFGAASVTVPARSSAATIGEATLEALSRAE